MQKIEKKQDKFYCFYFSIAGGFVTTIVRKVWFYTTKFTGKSEVFRCPVSLLSSIFHLRRLEASKYSGEELPRISKPLLFL